MLQTSLFLCGSLCKDMVHHKLLNGAIESIIPARAKGSIYRLEVGYPVFCASGDCWIDGDLVCLKKPELAFSLLDQFFAYKEEKADKCTFIRSLVYVETQDESKQAITYGIQSTKLPKTAKLIEDGNWKLNLEQSQPITNELTPDEKVYIKKLGSCTGREVVPYTPMTRQLEKMGIVVDKGRRPALTKLGKEIFQFLDV